MATKKQSAERQEAIDRMRETLKPGDTLYTILRHVSRSGMQRVISVVQPYTREFYACKTHGGAEVEIGKDIPACRNAPETGRSGCRYAGQPSRTEISFYDWSFNAAKAVGDAMDRDRGGVKVTGCGMDMGFALVYSISSALFEGGYRCPGERCRSSEHHSIPGELYHICRECGAEYDGYAPDEFVCVKCGNSGDGERKAATRRRYTDGAPKDGTVTHKDGGYALERRWL